jgi:chorismate-pyruvate lyase
VEWCVAKIGAEMFDALHAYGFGILLASASQAPVRLKDEGVVYTLHSRIRTPPQATVDLLDEVLVLPKLDDIPVAARSHTPVPLAVANLDGLLAARFTTPGIRPVSVHDLLDKQRLNPSALADGLTKVNTARAQWKKYAARKSRRSSGWLLDLLQDYGVAHPKIPLPVDAADTRLSVLMTIDPSFSYSTRRPISDGLITDKHNVAISGPRYAALLTFIGAARFLRAQRVAGHRVNFYVPLATSITLDAETALPILYPVEHASDHAVGLRWLTHWRMARASKTRWKSLAYQVLQTQKAQQSISCARGCLDYAWLAIVEKQAGRGVIGYWKSLLGSHMKEVPFETDNLVDCLTRHHAVAWLAHLRDVAIYLHNTELKVRAYTLKDVKEVTTAMNASTGTPLGAVLEREQGTVRFGHALRLLGQYNPAPLRDLIDVLDAVQTRDQLIRILAQAAQECAVASAKTQFIIVPSDEDLKYLLGDVEQYGARTVAGLLIILSALRYPRLVDANSADGSSTSVPPEPEGGKEQNEH